jgi:tetratricopeptide (TPR) repeat protein
MVYQYKYLQNVRTRSLLFILLVSAFHFSYAQKAIESQPTNQYSAALLKADRYLLEENYILALNEYERAWDLYPRQSYTGKKIDQINRTLRNTPLSAKLYEESIAKGDICFIARDYRGANAAYYNALKLDRTAQYPKDQLLEILKLFIDPENDLRYRILLIHATKSLEKKKYDAAIGFYQNALLIKPSDEWLINKISESSLLKEKAFAEMDEYSKCMAEAENLMEQKRWQDARSEYSKALVLKPNQNYPAAKIVLIDHLKTINKTPEQSYSSIIEVADRFFKLEDYENAGIHYQEAANLKTNNNYPQNMLKKLKHISLQANALSINYEAAVANSDILSLAGDEQAALIGYQTCIFHQPDDSYVESRITELMEKLPGLQEKEKAYNSAVERGNTSMESGNFNKALSEFRYASTIKPDESYPKRKINEIQNKLAKDKPSAEPKKEPTLQAEIAQLKQPNAKDKDAEKNEKAITRQDDSPKPGNTKPDVANSEIKDKKTAPSSNSKAVAILRVTNKQNVKQNEYEKAIAFADKAAADLNYAYAINGYKAAISIKPDEKYPQLEIDRITLLLKQGKSPAGSYKTAIIAADEAFNEKNFAEADSLYRSVCKNYPTEKYPQEKIYAINVLLGQQKALQANYHRILGLADRQFQQAHYSEAIISYQSALKLNPVTSYPNEQLDKATTLLEQLKIQQKDYLDKIADADKAYLRKEYDLARTQFEAASEIKPAEIYPKQKIAAINSILGQQETKRDLFENEIANADKALDKEDYNTAISGYKRALSMFPDTKYLNDRIASTNNLLIQAKLTQDKYNKAIMTAEKAYAAKDYTSSVAAYQSAAGFKPLESYPKERIMIINGIIASNKEKLDRQYEEYISQADELYLKQDMLIAQKAYGLAAALKPDENYPRDKYNEIAALLIAKSKAKKEAYEKAVADADKLFKAQDLDAAADLYLTALTMQPEIPYPGQMIARILKFQFENSVVEVNTENFVLKKESEKRFYFKPVDINLRKRNYITLKARNLDDLQSKLIINYGTKNTRNGGVVINSINTRLLRDFVIDISVQDNWFREDNDWLSLYAVAGDLEISSIKISQVK